LLENSNFLCYNIGDILARSRRNGLTGTDLNLYCYFYKGNDLESPSSVSEVNIYNYANSKIVTVPGSDITTSGDGIKKLVLDVPTTWSKGLYYDKWSFTKNTGDASQVSSFDFVVRESEYNQSSNFNLNNFVVKPELRTPRFSLYENKWLHFTLRDALGNLRTVDDASVLLKEYDSSDLYIAEDAIADGLNVYYKFNSSEIQAAYPGDFTREKLYEWVIRFKHEEEVYSLDPISFKFTEV
jgi:hypothetical protein